jgi:hypothetical protein
VSKTIKQWFDELPEEYSRLAKMNTYPDILESDIKARSMGEAFLYFSWYFTQEGYAFWEQVHTHYNHASKFGDTKLGRWIGKAYANKFYPLPEVK